MAQALTELPKSATGAAVSDWLFLDSAAAHTFELAGELVYLFAFL